MIAWNLTGQNISIYMDRETFTIPRDHRHANEIMEALDAEDKVTVRHYLDAKRQISVETQGRIGFDGHALTFDGEEIHNAIVDRLHFLWSNGLPYTALLRFMDRLMDNPSNRAVNELYRFLEACELPITRDGYFLAYKRVRDDFTDIHSGKFDNSVGAKPRVRRNEVDEDSTRTCSHGLHVCSASYLPHFGSWMSNRVVVVKVDPQDVVAVPEDYDNAKMRVCGYEVIDDVTDQFTNLGGAESILPRHFSDHGECDEVEDIEDIWNAEYDLESLEERLVDDEVIDDEYIVSGTTSAGPSSHATNMTLIEAQVREIKTLLNQGNWPIVRIAEVFNVNESTIRKIRDGKTWAWVI